MQNTGDMCFICIGHGKTLVFRKFIIAGRCQANDKIKTFFDVLSKNMRLDHFRGRTKTFRIKNVQYFCIYGRKDMVQFIKIKANDAMATFLQIDAV